MTYAQYGTIAASDYNTLVGGDPVTSSGTLNAVWATGGTNTGYGQTAEANVAVGDSVTAAKWANLVTKTANSASHQGTAISSVTAPAAGGTVTYLSAIPTNLTTIYTSRLNAASQGTTTANTATYASTWQAALTFTHTVTFANANAARYFFNAGGQLKVTCAHANTATSINTLYNGLASNIGTVVLSSPVTGSITVSGVSFNGITKVGGGGNAPTISTNTGYYALTTSNANVFTQLASTGPSGYLSSFIRIIAASNGSPGATVTLYTVWDEVPDGLVVGTGSATTVTIVAPETTYLPTASWGTPTVSGTVTGS
jgi:hypothetical protein